jgi:flavin reductase (DIM6/NTAB) family NADH-FMN oxidoreductase RutF
MVEEHRSDDLAAGFRDAMRRAAATVALVTTSEDGVWHGMAATAVTSVSTSPPSLLVAVNHQASIHDPLTRVGRFCVNLLALRHRSLVRAFSGAMKGADRFLLGEWQACDAAPPMLVDAPAAFECELDASLDYGSHSIFIGQVRAVAINGVSDPLIWSDAAFAAASLLGADS